MTQEQKDLLLKDLSARLPYRVKGNYQNSDDELLRKVTITYGCLEPDGMVMTGDIKPYLRPMSSMTDREKFAYRKTQWIYQADYCAPEYFDGLESYDWLNKNHFDYRGLIEKGLAIDATGLNIY